MTDFTRSFTRNTRWLVWVAIAFLIQIAIIVWFSDYAKPSVRKPAPAPRLALAGPASSELLALNDPTLFAVPHFRGFSGDAWLRPPAAPDRSFEWTEEPQWLTLATQAIPRLDLDVKPKSLDAFEVVSASVPEPSMLVLSIPPQFPDKSVLGINGILSRRELLISPELPAWSSTNLLTNTVVRIMVDGEGLPRSETLLIRSGLQEADNYALKAVRNLRFKPLTPANGKKPESVLDWGELVFQWHTAAAGGNK